MKKNLNKGFMLAETLIVTTFVAGVLIFIFIQFTNLSKNYNDSYQYNTVEGLYALRNIREYILTDSAILTQIENSVTEDKYLEITNCTNFTDKDYCLKLIELENINKIFISTNYINKDLFYNFDESFKKFINKINSEDSEKYRLIAEFNNSTYATIRFGE